MDIKLNILALILYSASFLLVLTGKNIRLTAGKAVAIAGFSVQTIAIILRWLASYKAGFGHAPAANLYESLILLSWSLIIISIIYIFIKKSLQAFIFACPAAMLILLYSSFAPGMDSGLKPLVPALKSNWLLIHVSSCMAGYAALILWTLLIAYNLVFRASKTAKAATVFINIGFMIFSAGIITGAVWAQTAWGRYWGWDPKETWALITWLVFAAALHARKKSGDSSAVYAGLAIFGLACILFTYFGVNLLPGLHSYF